MMRTFSLAAGTLAAALTFSFTAAQAAGGIPKFIAAAVADPARPDTDRTRDADRKPAETVAFAGLKQGDKVADLLPGSGYFTRIFSVVVGPKGRVYAVAPPRRPTAKEGSPDPAAAVQAIAANPHYNNVTVLVQRLTDLSLPEAVDMVWTSQNYHDLHNIPDVDVGAIDKKIFEALKPGGVFIVLDHAADKDSGFRDTSTLHRIDPEAVKKEVIAAGFKFEGQSDILRNSNDPHTAAVFDPAIRGKTDQFILKFRKPK
ncbi:MAG: methyltransferase [Gammaproteobacteria bacterium]|nr:methyltransferase [Gammaproteobacteria bacterium]